MVEAILWANASRLIARVLAEMEPGGGCFSRRRSPALNMKKRIVEMLLSVVRPGGKVVFVDYHRPRPAHPVRPVMDLVFAALEPFARALWHHSIADYAGPLGARFDWRKETLFGDLYQVVVATRR